MTDESWPTLTDAEKIQRLKETLETLISWLGRELGNHAALALLKRLHDGWIPGDEP